MSKAFSELASDKQGAVIKAINDACAEAGVADKVKLAGTTAHVGILNAGQLQQQGGASIKGTIGLDMNEKCENLKAQITKICSENDTKIPVEIACKYAVGDKVAPIENITPLKLEGGKMVEQPNVTFEHKDGEVILLDLWATWCPPCQAPMKHNVDMLAKAKPEWKDKVRLCGFSVDQGLDKLKEHIITKGF